MQLKGIFYFVSFFYLISGASIRNKRNTSDQDYEAWLTELESQIITNSDELQKSDDPPPKHPSKSDNHVPDKPPGKIDYDTAQEVHEPIVVTAHPYLTGSESPIDEQLVTEKVEEVEEVDNEAEISTNIKEDTKNMSMSIGGRHQFLTKGSKGEENDSKRSREILDKIMANVTKVDLQHVKHSSQQLSNDAEQNLNNGSEVETFVVRMRNRIPMIILVFVLSLLVLIACVVTVYQVLKTLNENSNITLISHYEYEDAKTLKS